MIFSEELFLVNRMESIVWPEFLQLLALHYYNSERIALTSRLIMNFLLCRGHNFDLSDNIKLIFANETKNLYIGAFEEFDFMVTSGLGFEAVTQYILERYINCRELFFKEVGISLSAMWHFSWEILMFSAKQANGGPLPVYKYKDKIEYGNRNYLASPSKAIENLFTNVSVLDINKLKLHIIESINKYNEDLLELQKSSGAKKEMPVYDKIDFQQFEKYLSLYSFNLSKLDAEKVIRFKEFPFFICDEKLVVLENRYFYYLPQKIHKLLLNSKKFETTKGKVFEKMALKLLSDVPYSNIEENITYPLGELDGLLNLRRSTWFVECKSRVLHSESLLGDIKKISKDFERGVLDAIKQAEKAIENKNTCEINSLRVKPRIGVLVVTEAIFPNESMLLLPYLLKNENFAFSKYLCVIFNYFELKKILEQTDKHLFEEYLIWRAKKNMPIFCFDECDYWAFFTEHYRVNKEMKATFKIAQENKLKTFYISKRFNNKEYLEGMQLSEGNSP